MTTLLEKGHKLQEGLFNLTGLKIFPGIANVFIYKINPSGKHRDSALTPIEVITSGLLPFIGDEPKKGDITAQTKAIFTTLNTILAFFDIKKENVCGATVILSHRADFPVFKTLWEEYFGTHTPTRMTSIADLVVDWAVVEVEFTIRFTKWIRD